jgi:hypothetical protein
MVNRLQDLYWREIVHLKVECEYMRRYRDSLTAWITRFAVIRAVVSVSALGTWAAIRAYPMVWGSIIAAAQVLDALQHALPFAARSRGASASVVELDLLLIDCQMEWEDIYSGRLDEREIGRRRHAMMKHRSETKSKNIPGGLPFKPAFFALAERDADSYFKMTYSTEADQ